MIGLLASFLLARNPAMTLPYARHLAKVGLAIVGIVLVLAAFAIWLRLHTQAAVQADRSAARAEALSDAREADERAHEAAESTRDAIQRSNDDAKAAADRSDDPLAAGLDRLRAEKDRDGKTARRADNVR